MVVLVLIMTGRIIVQILIILTIIQIDYNLIDFCENPLDPLNPLDVVQMKLF